LSVITAFSSRADEPSKITPLGRRLIAVLFVITYVPSVFMRLPQ
jgi:hypothetical protein